MNDEQLYQQFLNNGGDASFEEFLQLKSFAPIQLDEEVKKKEDTSPIQALPGNLSTGESDINTDSLNGINQTLENTQAISVPSPEIQLPNIQQELTQNLQKSLSTLPLGSTSNYMNSSSLLDLNSQETPSLSALKGQPNQSNDQLTRLAGKDDNAQSVNDRSKQDQDFFKKYSNKDYLDFTPIPNYTKETEIGSDTTDIIGGAVLPVEEWNNQVIQYQNQGIVEMVDDGNGFLTTPQGRFIYKIKDDNYLKQINDGIDLLNLERQNEVRNQNIDIARFNFGNINNNPESSPSQKYISELANLGYLPTDEERANLTSDEARQEFLAKVEAEKVSKEGNIPFQEAYNSIRPKYILDNNTKFNAGYDFYKNILIPAMSDESENEKSFSSGNGLYATEAQQEYDFYKEYFSSPDNVRKFGEYLLKEGITENLSWIKQQDLQRQLNRKQLFDNFLSFEYNKKLADYNFASDAVKNSELRIDNYNKAGDQQGALSEQNKFNQLQNVVKEKISTLQEEENQFNEINGIYTKVNRIKKEREDFYIRKENGDFSTKAQNFLAQIPLGIAESVRSTVTGAGRIINSVIPSQNFKDVLDSISNEELTLGNARISPIVERVKIYKGSDGFNYEEREGNIYRIGNDGALIKMKSLPQLTLEETRSDYKPSGFAFLTSKMLTDIFMTQGVGRGINTNAANLTNKVSQVFGVDSQLAKASSSFSKILNNPTNATVSGWYVQMYNDSYRAAEEGGIKSEEGKHLYAITQSYIQSLIQKLNPDTNFLRSINNENRAIVSALMNNNTEQAKLLFSELGKKMAGNVTRETGEELVQQVTQDVNNLLINNIADKNLRISKPEDYEDVVIGTVVPSMVASFIGGSGGRNVTVNNKVVNLDEYSRNDLLTELARDERGIQLVKDFEEDAYFESQKNAARSILDEVQTRKKYIDKIPENQNYSTKALSDAAPILQKIENKKKELNSSDDTFKGRIENEISSLQNEVNQILDQDINEQSTEETTSTSQTQETTQGQTSETANSSTGNTTPEPTESISGNGLTEDSQNLNASTNTRINRKGTLEGDSFIDEDGKEYSIQQYGKPESGIMIAVQDGTKVIGSAMFSRKENGNYNSLATSIQGPYQRKGIGTAIYDYFSRQGYKIDPAPDQTEAGRAFSNFYQGSNNENINLDQTSISQENISTPNNNNNDQESSQEQVIQTETPIESNQNQANETSWSDIESEVTENQIDDIENFFNNEKIQGTNTTSNGNVGSRVSGIQQGESQESENIQGFRSAIDAPTNQTNVEVTPFELKENQKQITSGVIATIDPITLPDGEDGFQVTVTDENSNPIFDRNEDYQFDFGSQEDVEKFISQKQKGYNLQGRNNSSRTEQRSEPQIDVETNIGKDVTFKFLGDDYKGKIIQGTRGLLIESADGTKYNPSSKQVTNIVDSNGAEIQFQKDADSQSYLSQEEFSALVDRLKIPFKKAFSNLNVVYDWNSFSEKAQNLGIDVTAVQYLFGNENNQSLSQESVASLTLAKQMELDGISNSDIRRETGWFKGVDGIWKNDIVDAIEINKSDDEIQSLSIGNIEDIKVDQLMKARPVEDLIDTKRLYEIFPNLAGNIKFLIYESKPRQGEGFNYGKTFISKRRGEAIIGINIYNREGEGRLGGLPISSRVHRILSHESQHILQGLQGLVQRVSDIGGTSSQEIFDRLKRNELTIIGQDNRIIKYSGRSDNELRNFANRLYESNSDEIEARAAGNNNDLSQEFRNVPQKEYWISDDTNTIKLSSIDGVDLMATNNGIIYGAKLPDGTIYFNTSRLNYNTPIHEFSHLWEQIMPSNFNKGVQILKQTKTGKEIFNKLKTEGNYGHDDNRLWREALNTHIGNYGEWKQLNPRGKMGEFIQWFKDFFAKLGKALGIKINPDTELRIFTDEVLGDLLGNKEIKVENIDVSIEPKYSWINKSDFNTDGSVKESVINEINNEKESIKNNAILEGNFMKAPNGKDTNLNEDQWIQVRTNRFKNWFGDWENNPSKASKALDENGEPKMLYHVGEKKLEFYNPSFKGRSDANYGIFFSDSQEAVKDYEETWAYNNKFIHTVYAKLENPFIIDISKIRPGDKFTEHFDDYQNDRFQNENIGWEGDMYLKILQYAKNNGYDGAILRNTLDPSILQDTHIVFNSNQIKSTIDNFGTFSLKDNRIQFSIGNETGINKDIQNVIGENNPIPQKTLKELGDNFRTAISTSQILERLKQSDWYSNLNEEQQSLVTADNLKDLMLESTRMHLRKRQVREPLTADNNARINIAVDRSRFTKFKEKWFANEGGVMKPFLNSQDRAIGNAAWQNRTALQTVRKLNKLADKIKFSDWPTFDNAMKGDADSFESLPEEIKPYVTEMREKIDGLSNFLVVNNLVTPDQAVNIQDNLGSYVTRGYDFFERGDSFGKVFRRIFKKNFSSRFDEKKWANAVTVFQQNVLNEIALDRDPEWDNRTQEEIQTYARTEGERRLEEYLRGLENEYNNASSSKGADTSVLEKRKDVPEPIRVLLEEYTDPRLTFALTVSRLSQLGHQRKFLSELKELGMGTLFFEEGDVNIPSTHTVKIASDTNQAYSPLNGLYTTPEFKDVFLDKSENNSSDMAKVWGKATGAVKYGKTILSPLTQAVNFTANFGFLVNNGLWDIRKMSIAAKVFYDETFGNDSSSEEFLRELIEENIIGQNVQLNELQNDFHKNIEKNFLNDITKKPIVKKILNNTFLLPERTYKASDDFFKAYAYYNEADSYAKSIYGKGYKDLEGEEKARIRKIASEVTKNTLANYDRKYKGADVVRQKTGNLLGNFLSFQAESIRTYINSIQIALRDIKDPETRSVGIRRLSGVMAFNVLYATITSLVGEATGAGLMGVLGAFNDDDEEEVNKNLNLVVAPWARSTEKYFELNNDGTLTYYTLGNINPYGILYRTVNSYKAGTASDENGGAGAVLREITNPFVDVEMSAKWLLNLYSGQNDYGKELVSTNDKIEYTWNKLSPTVFKVIKDNTDVDDRNNFEWINLFGIKKYVLNPTDQLNFRFNDWQKKVNDKGKDIYALNFKVQNKKMSNEEAEKKYNELSNDIIDITDDFRPVLEAHLFFGADPNNSLKKGKKGYINQYNAAKDYVDYLFTPTEVVNQQKEETK